MVAHSFEPAYLSLLRSGELAERVQQAYEIMHECVLCGRECRANRYTSKGECRTGSRALLSSSGPHMGEEDPLRGHSGSGTIFFAWCNLRCQYCQNSDISQLGCGQEVEPEEIGTIMLELQARGCHNINFVSPSHVVAPILAAVLHAAGSGLRLPLVYNTGGYDSIAALQLLDGVIDIYMPDIKYADAEPGLLFSQIEDYPSINQRAVKEMHRQVGDLILDEQGIALRGLLVRHLVLPEGLAGTTEIARFLAEEISPDTYINVMNQYRPCHRAHELPPLDRSITAQEYTEAVEAARQAGLHRLDRRRFGRLLISWR
jgi:putative pyruvate formate lyase activating enzyme